MSAIDWVSATRFPYQRLENEVLFDDYEGREKLVGRPRNWYKFRRVHIRKRFRIRVKVPSLRRFLRRKIRLVSTVRVSCAKVLKRLKEGQGYFGDLFAGNYLFMQVNPTPLKHFEKSYYHGTALNLRGLPSSYSIPRIA